MTIAVAIVAYNRPDALLRLLGSLSRAHYDAFDHVPLIISIDGGGHPRVAAIAGEFHWPFGQKRVHLHKTNLGLKEHVLAVADHALEYDGIVMLEDDLVVSPWFYQYAHGALEAYGRHHNIAGISLYSYRLAHGFPFVPIVAQGHTFLVKFPSSWGQAWTSRQWQRFRAWLGDMDELERACLDAQLPVRVAAWPTASSWKKEFARYLISSGRYIVYPSVSLTTNMGDAGSHYRRSTLVDHVPLQFAPLAYNITDPDHAVSYDQFFELESRSLETLGCQEIVSPGVVFDLYGQKPFEMVRDSLTVSSRRPRSSLQTYGLELLPHELNVIYGIPGNTFYLGEGASFQGSAPPSRLDLLRHQTALLGGRDMVKLLGRRLLAKIGKP